MNIDDLRRQPEPAQNAEFFTIGDHVGHRLIYTPTEHRQGVETAFGAKDAIVAGIACVDCAEEWEDVLVFGGRLISVLKGRIGELVLGVLGQEQTRPGMNPAWVLGPFTEDDAEEAIAFWNELRGEPEPEPEPAPRRQVARRAGDASGAGGTRGSALRQAAATAFQ